MLIGVFWFSYSNATRSVVTLKMRKEYLDTVTYNTPVLVRIK